MDIAIQNNDDEMIKVFLETGNGYLNYQITAAMYYKIKPSTDS